MINDQHISRRRLLALITGAPFACCHGYPAEIASGGEAHQQDPQPAPQQKQVAESAQRFVQPPYDGWRNVRVGMTAAEVMELLGKPLRTESERIWIYGHLDFGSPNIPEVYKFYLVILGGRVHYKKDPIGGPVSKNGEPTVPQIILPQNKAIFDHYPRFVDFRWYPSSGAYPMTYEIEHGFEQYVGTLNPDGTITTDRVYSSYKAESMIPHIAKSMAGTTCRWRVRAKNEVGTSDWSDFSYFYFRSE